MTKPNEPTECPLCGKKIKLFTGGAQVGRFRWHTRAGVKCPAAYCTPAEAAEKKEG